MRGRKPKPTVLKLITGNPGKRPLNKEEPKPDLLDGPITAPSWFNEPAKREWDEQISYLTQNGVIGKNELSILTQYCQLYGDYVSDAQSRRPMNAAIIAQMRGLRADLGIGPSVRSKFVKGKKSEPANSWEALK
jgi:phage terminase small subunit